MDSIVKRLHEKRRIETAKSILESQGYKVSESTGEAEYICKSIKVDDQGVMEIVCYDTVEKEEFDKYIGQVDSPSARKAASLILRDWKFEVPNNIRNELIGTFGLEDFGYQIEESEDINEASDSMYHQLSKMFPNKREFKDKDNESGNLRDLIDDLENKGIEYEIYNDKTDNGCTVFFSKVEDLAEAKNPPNEYKFAIKYRLSVQSDVDEYYQYPPNMDYMEEVQDAATADWNSTGMEQYAPESLEVTSAIMSFDGIDCILTFTTGHELSDYEINRLEEWITGQMSDGWGEGFEQREIATGRDTAEEWIEPEDEDEEGYYDSYDVTVYYYGQFWWSDKNPNHLWAIERIQ